MARDRDNKFYDYVAPTKTVDASDAAEKAKIAAMREANEPQNKKYIGKDGNYYDSPVEAQLGRDIGSSTDTGETPAERTARIAAEREEVQAGKDPSNPMPDEDPGEGMYWANYGGVWRKYKYTTNLSGGNPNKNSNKNPNGNPPVTTTTTAVTQISETTRDAFEALKLLFEQYGLGSLADKITGYMRDGIGPNQAALLLKQSDEYKKRFAGNQKRLTMGLNVVSEAEYLDLENAYGNTLRAYGLGNMLSLDRNKNQEMFANYIGNDIGATEFKDRVQLATGRVINADPSVKELFKKWYPSLTDGDLASYFLNPSENFPKLQEKATTAEIGAAALGQGLTTSIESATDLAKFGVDRSTALKGYATIGEVLPTATKLGDIYNESRVQYTQTEGEAEVFKGSSSASNKRNRLASLERGSFSASSGNAPSRKSSAAGQI